MEHTYEWAFHNNREVTSSPRTTSYKSAIDSNEDYTCTPRQSWENIMQGLSSLKYSFSAILKLEFLTQITEAKRSKRVHIWQADKI